jgi:hypothetical protein
LGKLGVVTFPAGYRGLVTRASNEKNAVWYLTLNKGALSTKRTVIIPLQLAVFALVEIRSIQGKLLSLMLMYF